MVQEKKTISGYFNLLILGYVPWVILDLLVKYMQPVIAVILTLLIISWFILQAIRERDYIGITFTTGLIAYSVHVIYNLELLAIYSRHILLIVGVIAFLSVLINKPFTMVYAKKMVSEDKWQHPVFIKINTIISLSWVAIFLVEYLLKIIDLQYHEIINIILVVFGIKFSQNFPDYYRDKIKSNRKL